MHSLLLLAALIASSPVDEPTSALRARIAAEVDRPQAVADLYRLYERRDEKGDLRDFLATLNAVKKAPKARADLRALAQEMRAQLAVSLGQLPQTAALFDEIAPIRSWSVIGPFENEARAGLLAVYGPEKDGYDPKAVYRGKEHDVAWRTLPAGYARYGYVDLAAVVYPRQDVAIYAATVLRPAKAQAAIFHLGASGGCRVWLNGRLVHEDGALHPSRFDQQSFAADLVSGDNFLLVKLAHSSGKPGFSMRIADAKDAPLVELARAARAPDARATAFAAAVEAPAKKPAPFDKDQPFKNLGLRMINGDRRGRNLRIEDVELTMKEYSGTVGMDQMLKHGAADSKENE